MSLIVFSPSTTIKSADVNANFSGLASGSLISANAIDLNQLTATAIKLGYAPVTAAQNGLGAGPTDITGLTLTFTAPTTRYIKLTAFVPIVCTTTGQNVTVEITEGSTALTYSSLQSAIAGVQLTAVTQYVVLASAGSHTYKVTTHTSGGTWNMNAASGQIAFLLAEAI